MKVDRQTYIEFLEEEKLLKKAFTEYETTLNDLQKRVKVATLLSVP